MEPLVIVGVLFMAFMVLAVLIKTVRGPAKVVPAEVAMTALDERSSGTIPPPAERVDDPKTPPLSAREARWEVLRVRRKDGLCRHCDDEARYPMPVLVRQSSLFDWVYRRLNVVSLNRYKLVINPGTDAPAELCGLCRDIVCGRKEKEIVEVAAETAGFFDKQRMRVYVFERHECDEVVQADVLEARRPRKKKQAAAPSNVLSVVKSVNGNS